jgi:hypothetical protein
MNIPVTPVALTGANQQVWTGLGEYCGFAIDETSGVVGKVRIWDGTSAAGTLLDVIDLDPAQSARENYTRARRFLVGVYVEIVAGVIAGSVVIG